MVLDPLVLLAFVYVCPKAELPAVFEKISPYFATAWLIKRVKDDRYFFRSDVSICKAPVVVKDCVFLILGRRSY